MERLHWYLSTAQSLAVLTSLADQPSIAATQLIATLPVQNSKRSSVVVKHSLLLTICCNLAALLTCRVTKPAKEHSLGKGLKETVPRPPQIAVAEDLLQRIDGYVHRELGSANPGSTTEYFLLLLSLARGAIGLNDYGIAAALTIPTIEGQLVSIGVNSVYSGLDPTGHAEVNAIRGLQAALLHNQRPYRLDSGALWDVPQTAKQEQLFSRSISLTGIENSVTLYTTLEPCPMCTVAIIGAGVERVVIATPDPTAGGMAPERFQGLGSAWSELATKLHLQVDFAGPSVPESALRIPAELAALIEEVFLVSKPELDGWLESRGFLYEIMKAADHSLKA
jgi:tRNA(Arg) A34 adenosine deaminase TadA